LNPADEVLVLTFSRAAVDAARNRSKQHGLDAVSIRTFDSFAAQLILEADGEVPNGSFDQRIRRATAILSHEDTPDLLHSIRHVLIDEAQDVVGDRAEMVLAIFTAIGDGLGFTVLGDPLQGIYDFQLQNDARGSKLTSSEFIERLTHDFAAESKVLQCHYRASSPQMRALIPIAADIRALSGTSESAVPGHGLLDEFRRSNVSGCFLDEGGALEPLSNHTTAILAATNYEIMIASELLWEEGTSHIVRRQTQDMGLAPWVYSAFRDLEARSYSEQSILAKLAANGCVWPEDRWNNLKSAEGDFRSHSSLNLATLGERLRAHSVPISLTVDDSHALTLSTVHRSKGLEFENVIYLPPKFGSPAADLNWTTLRQKYVALSRARELVISSQFPKNALKPATSASNDARCVELRFKGRDRRPVRMEFMNDDIEDLVPFETEGAQAEAVQDTLIGAEVLGQQVVGQLDHTKNDTGSPARYILVTNDGVAIGRTSAGFGQALENTFRDRRVWEWPSGFTGARISSVECATGSPEETRLAGIGNSGLWLVPRLTGLVRPNWK
jgi:DNA helicase-2/ATP-dependent DNA helicase PcrA